MEITLTLINLLYKAISKIRNLTNWFFPIYNHKTASANNSHKNQLILSNLHKMKAKITAYKIK